MCMRLRAPPLTPGVPLCPRPKRSRTRSVHRAGPRRTAARVAGEHPPSPCQRRRERSTSTDSHCATNPRAPRTHHATVLLHSMVNFLLFLLSGCLDWTCVASALRHRSCHSHRSDQTPGLSSLRSRLCVRSCGNNLRSLESQREVPDRAAQTHPETMAVDSGLWKLLEKMDGVAKARLHSIIANRPALITIVYQTSVNVSTMTVTPSQTEAGHGGSDGVTADARLRTNEHHSNDLPNVHGPALCLGARACIAAFLLLTSSSACSPS